MQKSFWRSALLLALPIALQNLLTSCATLIDTAMIVPLGNTAVAAVGVAGRFSFMLNVIAFGFSSGSATLISQYWGVGDKAGIRRTFGVGISGAMILAFLYAAILRIFPGACISLFGPEADAALLAREYLKILAFAIPLMMFSQVGCAALRATENVRVPLVAAILGVVVNTSLNYCLIGGHFGFSALGLRGAAIATVAGAGTQAFVALAAILFGKNPIRAPIGEYFTFSRSFVFRFFGIAWPVLLNETTWAVGTNIYVMVLARQGTEPYSGYTLFDTLQQLFFVFFVGICHASAIMVGKEAGRGDRDEAYRTAKRFLFMTPLLGFIVGAALVVLRNPLLSLFDVETEGSREIASLLLLFYGFWLWFRMISYTAICGIFRAGGDTRIGCIYDLGTMFGVGVPLVCLAGLVWKLPFFWIIVIMFAAEDIPKSILCVRYFLKKKWIRCLTDGE